MKPAKPDSAATLRYFKRNATSAVMSETTGMLKNAGMKTPLRTDIFIAFIAAMAELASSMSNPHTVEQIQA